MRWTFFIQQKLKVAALLACIMALIVITNLLGRKSVGDFSRSFSAIYNDRLVPATDIFHLTENLYHKRFLIEDLLFSENTDAHTVADKLDEHNRYIANLVTKYRKNIPGRPRIQIA